DETANVVADVSRAHPDRFRYLFEKRQGKSYALNAGIAAAAGTILAFTDDDITADRHWLAELTKNLWNRDWAAAGGRIVMEWTREPPRWLSLTGPYKLG